MTRELHLRLRFPPEWDRIESVRQAVGHCVVAAFGEHGGEEAIAMVAAELLENAVKYGKPGAAVELAVEERSDAVSVSVSNVVEIPSRHASSLRERIAWLREFDDPLKAYQAALEQAYEESADGGLGIVRIAYEGRCAVDCDTSTPGRVTTVAMYALPRDGSSAAVEPLS